MSAISSASATPSKPALRLVESDPLDGAAMTNSRSDFAELINNTWRKGAEPIIETGQYLIFAKAELDRDQFNSLVECDLDFDPSVARKLLRIGGNELICAPGHRDRLPPCWTIIWELSKLEDDVLRAALADGKIHPGMTRKDAIALKPPKHAESEGHEEGETSTPLDPKSAFAAAWDTAFSTEEGRKAITAKLDQAGRDGLCAVLSKELGAELRDHILRQWTLTNETNAAIVALAMECAAMLDDRPDRNRSRIRQKLELIEELAGAEVEAPEDETVEKPAIEKMAAKAMADMKSAESGQLDRSAFKRGLGTAGRPGSKFSTITMEPNGIDAGGNCSFAHQSRDHSSR